MLGLAPFFLIIVMTLGFQPLAGFISRQTGFSLSGYYSLLALTSAAVISAIPGMWFAIFRIIVQSTPPTRSAWDALKLDLSFSFLISFILVFLFSLAADPVPSEGWIRMLFVSVLLAVQSVTSFLAVSWLSANALKALIVSKVYGVLIVILPVGLVLHSPWNIVAFISPYYWIAWSWLTEVPSQSMVYSLVSILIALPLFVFALRKTARGIRLRG